MQHFSLHDIQRDTTIVYDIVNKHVLHKTKNHSNTSVSWIKRILQIEYRPLIVAIYRYWSSITMRTLYIEYITCVTLCLSARAVT